MVATCDNCGGSVSEAFERVFSYNCGTLAGCPSCSTAPWLREPDKDVVEIIRRAREEGEHPNFSLGEGHELEIMESDHYGYGE